VGLMILGIDEVGRGPWAGPLVVAAVVLSDEAPIEGLTDSKKLTKKRREALDVIIRQQALGFGIGWVPADEIDRIGLSAALRLATVRAVEQVKTPYTEIIIDGTINFLKETAKGKYVTTMPKADLLIQSVSAASIIAKVARDAYMTEQDTVYQGYHFASHVGYGTAVHRQAIDLLGVTPLHRLSFAPLQKYKIDAAAERTTKSIGDEAETLAAQFLENDGHTVLERNWKTKFCEVDIISAKGSTIYFTEVKYRKDDTHGDGLAAVTAKKQQQMRFAAEYYLAVRQLGSALARIAVVAVAGAPMRVIAHLELE
jgi:ribonuclease HII